MKKELKEAWGWVGLEPEEIAEENVFGNLLIRDVDGKYWRLCPEELSCEVVAENRQEFESLRKNKEFLLDWNMENLAIEAREKLGSLSDGRKYCLKIPSVLGGEYGGENLGTISLKELISFSGYVAEQIKDLPDGANFEFRFVE